MNTKLKISMIITVIILIVSALILLNKTITGNSINDFYSYTKAICNENSCQDYYIACNGNKLIDKTPITGSSIKNINNLTTNQTENFCN